MRSMNLVNRTSLESELVLQGNLYEILKVLYLLYSSLAQSVEHAAVNRSVVGSSPTGGVFYYVKLYFTCSFGSVVKRLRHRPFTAVTRVRFPSESLRSVFSMYRTLDANFVFDLLPSKCS